MSFLKRLPVARQHDAVARVATVTLIAVLGACAREPVAPSHAPVQRASHAPSAALMALTPVEVLLDSFTIGGVYTVLPRGGYGGGSSYARSPEKEQYAGTVAGHPTGLELPVGLPVRILASGSYTSRATAAFQHDYCGTAYGAWDFLCTVSAFTYTLHGLAAGPGVLTPYEPGAGLRLAWSRTAGYYDQVFAPYPSAQIFRGSVPAFDTATSRELYFRRSGCCYYIPWGTTASWEIYEGSWRFGVVPDDGGQAEFGVPAVLRMVGPRTDALMTAPATFRVFTTTGDPIRTTRWWYVRAANNVFDGDPVPLVTITQPWTMQVPRYPAGQRTVFEELAACTGRTTCTYQAATAGAVVVQAALTEIRVLAARNTGASGAHVRITADSTTLSYGDTTVFRVTVPGTPDSSWTITGFRFSPLESTLGDSHRAVEENLPPRATRTETAAVWHPSKRAFSIGARSVGRQTERVAPARKLRPLPFRDAAFSCEDVTISPCYDDPRVTGYEIVTAIVDGIAQIDSVLVTVTPGLLVACSPLTPVRGRQVHCVATMSDSTSFMLTRLRSATSGRAIVDSVLVVPTAQTSFDWTGVAIVDTRVEIFGRSGETEFHGQASFEVLSDSTFRDSILPDPPQQLAARGRPILLADYPGFGGVGALKGGLGRTMHLYPDYEVSVVQGGPNRRLAYTKWFKWTWGVPARGELPVRAGTYISTALFPNDPFYQLQTGGRTNAGNSYCTAADMERLRQEIFAHEIVHYRASAQLRRDFALPTFYERMYLSVSEDSVTRRTEALFYLKSRDYMRALSASDSTIDEPELTTSLTCTMRLP